MPEEKNEPRRLWTRDELVLAINLYCQLPFGKLHSKNPQIQELARLINRTPSSVAFKLVNFASFDPDLKARGIAGASNASKLDKKIWDEFYKNWDAVLLESERLLAKLKNSTIEEENNVDVEEIQQVGLEKERVIKARVNQNIFRKLVLANYDNKCCITGITVSELLVASHIVPWSVDENNRLNPRNGLCLNALHDKAFDRGLLTIDADSYKIRLSNSLSHVPHFKEVDGHSMILPEKFLPNKDLLRIHNGNCKF